MKKKAYSFQDRPQRLQSGDYGVPEAPPKDQKTDPRAGLHTDEKNQKNKKK